MLLRCLFFLLLATSPGYSKPKSQSKSKSNKMCNQGNWSDSDRQGILDVHNNLRSSIAKGSYVAKTDKKPSATDMEAMVYDCGLEASAQQWADTCPTGHSGTAGKGENIYWGCGAKASTAWGNEFQEFGWPSNTLTMQMFNSGIGHATQMAWWSTNRVGCGVKSNCKSSRLQYPYELVIICHYTPQGNVINQEIYHSGKTCSACNGGYKCDKKSSLCS